MKKILIGIVVFLTMESCDNEATPLEGQIRFKFTHDWDGISVGQKDFYAIQFTNANGQQISIERLRYLISKITLTHEDGETKVLDGYNLIDLENPETLTFRPSQNIVLGRYTKVSMTFGFNQADNQDGIYPDLNAASWNVPGMLGGGYHFMQFDGKFINQADETANFNYHAIRAVDRTDPDNLIFQDTFFEIDLGALNLNNNTEIEVNMNIAEWFKNPNLWDLNQLSILLMPNFDAQIKIAQNGRSVFTGQTND